MLLTVSVVPCKKSFPHAKSMLSGVNRLIASTQAVLTNPFILKATIALIFIWVFEAEQSLAAGSPDLTVNSIGVAKQAVLGKTLNVTSTIKNAGNAPASAYAVNLYLSKDNIINPAQDTLLGTWSAKFLGIGLQTQVTIAPVVKNVVPGLYYLGAIADAKNTVIEGNETNNIFSTPFQINVFPGEVPNKWVFVGNDNPTNVNENIWVTDGTAAGTKLLNDNHGDFDFFGELTQLDKNRVLYVEDNELWVTNGTFLGTVQLTDLNTALDDETAPLLWLRDYYKKAVLGNGKVVFSALFDVKGQELAEADGTLGGTKMLKDINTVLSSEPDKFTAIGNSKAVFSAIHPLSGREPWVTDGTAAGTLLLKNIVPNDFGSNPYGFTPLGNGKAIFATDISGKSDDDAWVTDGTPAGTLMLKANFHYIPSFVSLGNGRAIISGYETYITDGTISGTKLINMPCTPGKNDSELLSKGKVLFRCDSSDKHRLWITDGTVAGTKMLASIAKSSTVPGLGFKPSVPLGNGLSIFIVKDLVRGEEPWVTDGTVRGTKLIGDFWPGAKGSANYADGEIQSFGNGQAIIHLGHPLYTGLKYWITNGTLAGTKRLDKVNPVLDKVAVFSRDQFGKTQKGLMPVSYKKILK